MGRREGDCDGKMGRSREERKKNDDVIRDGRRR